ncbi:MAG: nucleotidyltransferase family protein [bacterium]
MKFGEKMDIFPEIVPRKEFSEISDEPYFSAIEYINGKKEDFKNIYVANKAANTIKYSHLRKVSLMMKEFGFSKFIPIKGAMLLNTLFEKHQGIREMADIDLLVHPEEFHKIPEFLNKNKELKYVSRFSPTLRKHFGEELSFSLNSTLIELHSTITLVKIKGLVEEIFEKSIEKANPDGELFLTPPIEYTAIIMLLHDYSRGDFSDLTYKRLLEFYVVLFNSDFLKLKNIAEKYELDTMLNSHLFLIWTMIENPFFNRYNFEIIEHFGLLKKDEEFRGFRVENNSSFEKVLYGKRWKTLKLRNMATALFKAVAAGKN